jgi:S1-C subfamily serine protease
MQPSTHEKRRMAMKKAFFFCDVLVAFAMLLAAGQCRAGEESPSRVARGKAATALVEMNVGLLRVEGSAFCIHPSGLFVTNEHVVQRAGTFGFNPGFRPPGMVPNRPLAPPRPQESITIVLNPGQKGEHSYRARVVRSDKDADLALLRVEGTKDLPVLALGSDENLEEAMEVVAFGFPFGTGLAGRQQHPAVSVNVGRITSLRRKGDALDAIQLDAAVNVGNSGGPVLDKDGKVIGVIAATVGRGTGVNFAIPVSTLTRFLARPDVQFRLPRLAADNIHKPTAFEARVVSLVPSSAPIAADLILKPATHPAHDCRGR